MDWMSNMLGRPLVRYLTAPSAHYEPFSILEPVGGEFIIKRRWVTGTGRGSRISSGNCPSE